MAFPESATAASLGGGGTFHIPLPRAAADPAVWSNYNEKTQIGRMDKKPWPYCVLFMRRFTFNYIDRVKVKRRKKVYYENINFKKDRNGYISIQ